MSSESRLALAFIREEEMDAMPEHEVMDLGVPDMAPLGEIAVSTAAPSDTVAGGLIVAEFNYIAESAFQSQEDRARVAQFFFITFATFIAAIFSSQLDQVDLAQLFSAFALVFFINAALGIITLLQLTRLRLAWIECAIAMNQMKEHLILEQPELEAFFRWRSSTVPPAFKAVSVAFLLAVMVAILSGLAFGSGVAFLALASDPNTVPWSLSIAAGIITAAALLVVYWLFLQQPHP